MFNNTITPQILVKSFGLGVYEVQIVPIELLDENMSDSFSEFVKSKICEFGLGSLQGLFVNKHSVGSFFAIFSIGHEPSRFEISMMNDQIGNLECCVDGFGGRIEELKKYYV